MPRRPIFLDYLATTPVDPRVVQACLPYLTASFGNPASSHAFGQAAAAAVAEARASVAGLLGCAPGEIVFTGGGSEGDTLAIRGAALARRPRRGYVITQATEHPAVLAACDALARLHDYRVTHLPVDEYGLVDPATLEAAMTEDTVLVSIMHANNETGTLQPISELASIAHAGGALFHTDAAQTAGKIPISVGALGVDLLSLAGHKLYAPKGVGALYVTESLELEPAIYGGGQERGLRGGTENVALIAGLGHASGIAVDAVDAVDTEATRLRALRDLLHDELTRLVPAAVEVNGHPEQRLPNALNVSIAGAVGPRLLAATTEIAASTGSACHEGVDAPSPVLTAMGLPAERAMSAVRLSVGRWTSDQDVSAAASAIARVCVG
ncbi:MAG: aminotransferase class V-fold PLP-dependent enzyme [Actinophytocola sp.]|nr:aminotransferase class V-fold PLP-dependent enzyme [Actinophytocola sp.]